MKIEFEPIGYIQCDIRDVSDAPRYHAISDREGVIVLNPELMDGLYRLEERSHLVVLFHFHKSSGDVPLRQSPPTGSGIKGVFSTCSPRRPNRIGMDVVELEKIEGNRIYIRNIDMIDGTPVLDIKPYKVEVGS